MRSAKHSPSSRIESMRLSKMRTGRKILLMSGTRWLRRRLINKLIQNPKPSRSAQSKDPSIPTNREQVTPLGNPSRAELRQKRSLRPAKRPSGNRRHLVIAENLQPKTVWPRRLRARFSATMRSYAECTLAHRSKRSSRGRPRSSYSWRLAASILGPLLAR